MTAALKFITDFLKRGGISIAEAEPCTKTAAYPPKEAHVTLSRDATDGKKILFVGDVHGCLHELEELLVKCQYSERRMVLIFVGDIVSKGPNTVQVVQLARRLGAYSVRGNHEQSTLRELLAFQTTEILRDKYKWLRDFSDEDLNYLKNLPYTLSVESLNTVVVHAGLTPGVEIEDQNPQHVMTMRNYVPEKFKSTNVITEGHPWALFWSGPRHVIFGHDAQRKLQQYRFATGLDTGCVYGGHLTGLLVEDDCWDGRKFVQVKAHRQYVPTSS